MTSALCAVVLAACQSPTQVQTPASVTITTIASTLDVGARLQLAASVQPASHPQGVTWSSSDPTVATVSATGLVEGKLPGDVRITATSTADPSLRDDLDLVVTGCPPPRVLSSGLITSDVTWDDWIASPACLDYRVTATIINQGSLLTIEPGVVVGFETDRSMVIRGTAGLLAAGTAQKPIRITAVNPQRGGWDGLLLDATSHPQNRFEHVTIEYAGVGSWSGSLARANLMILGAVETTLENVTFRNSAAYGLSIGAGARLRAHGNNQFTGNASGPAHVYASVAHYLDATSMADGNDTDLVAVLPDRITSTVTWVPIGDGYRILQTVARYAFTIDGAGAFLTLAPGVVLVFEDDMAMTVLSGAALSAVGTAQEPIVMTGAQQVPGHWRGLRFFTNDARNHLEHVIIEFAGGNAHSGAVRPANLYFDLNARARVTSTTLRDGGGYGLYARNGTRLDDFSGNVLSGNAVGAAFVDAPVVNDLLPSSHYTGNGRDAVFVEVSAKPILAAATWRDIGVPFVILESSGYDLRVEGATLTIEEGVEILFQNDMGLLILLGALEAKGTQQNPVRLAADGGQWQGVAVDRGVASFMYTTLVGAGSRKWGTVLEPGAVTVVTSGNMSSTAIFGPGTSQSGAPYGVVFGYGATFGVECGRMTPVYVHVPESTQDHCG